MINKLPIEILLKIVEKIVDPIDFRNFALVSRWFAEVCLDPRVQKYKKQQIAKKVYEGWCNSSQTVYGYYEYSLLPNGTKIGDLKVWVVSENPVQFELIVHLSPDRPEDQWYFHDGELQLKNFDP